MCSGSRYFQVGVSVAWQHSCRSLFTSTIKARRFQWMGHLMRASCSSRTIRQVLDGRPRSSRPQGRPRLRWEDKVLKDAGRLGVSD